MAEIVVLVGLGLSMVVLGVATWLFRMVARLLGLPFGPWAPSSNRGKGRRPEA